MKYYIIAGEASGDLHAASLMQGLYARDPQCDVRFWGGDAMTAVGGTRVRHYRETAVMGVVEVLARSRRILQRMAFCKKDLLAWQPDAVILVDYPSFNLRIARFAKAHGIKVLWYIAPKVWAHKAWRVKNLRRDVDALYCIFPFELDWFRQRGIEPRFFGNPLVERIAGTAFQPVGEGKLIALLPGSRDLELQFLLPRFAALEHLLDADPRTAGYRLVVACAPSLAPEAYRKYLPESSRIELVAGRTYDILHQADAAVVSSGTASLETALIGTPQVVCYGMNPLTFAIVSRTVKLPCVSLANLELGRMIFRELLQDQATPENMKAELEQLLFDGEYRAEQKAGYEELKIRLGGPGASDRTARDIYEETARV
ncbi:MAG: lipid-A-disaccharide synthase [Bacteroidales bacterium]|nr:lipid-A-disaccharide synthase [Bacteroidales bacterium]